MKKHKILIVEDNERLVEFWKETIGDEVEVIWAQTLEEGEKVFKENQEDLALIVVDCCIPGHEPNSMWLVEKIKKSGFTKPIIAKSSDPQFCQRLIAVGASHSASAPPPGEVPDPGEVPELVLKLLKEARKA